MYTSAILAILLGSGSKQGKMPVTVEQTPTGTIFVKEPKGAPGVIALYARVSSADQKHDLDQQISRLLEYANAQGWMVAKEVAEIGSGLNAHRPTMVPTLVSHSLERYQLR
jgi:predicted site-specific integrase-resolvase